jgi:dTDP-glucose 4,6-dehydratase
VYHDLRAPLNDQLCAQIGEHDYVLHLAAGTHVDRSIEDPMSFVLDNVVATTNMLEFARKVDCGLFLNFSTDEVFGPAPVGVRYNEDDRYNAGNPYSATKAGAVQMGVAYHNTYGVPVITTHTMNVIGKMQHPEKFVPMTIAKVSAGEVVTIHADKTRTKAGSRFYIDAENVADAVLFILDRGKVGEKYNIVGERETDNLELANMLASVIGRPLRYEMTDFHSCRPGHDLRYALDGSKMESLGWTPPSTLEKSLASIVQWTRENPQWVKTLEPFSIEFKRKVAA